MGDRPVAQRARGIALPAIRLARLARTFCPTLPQNRRLTGRRMAASQSTQLSSYAGRKSSNGTRPKVRPSAVQFPEIAGPQGNTPRDNGRADI